MKTKAWMILAVALSFAWATGCGEDEEAASGDDTQAAADETGGEDTDTEPMVASNASAPNSAMYMGRASAASHCPNRPAKVLKR